MSPPDEGRPEPDHVPGLASRRISETLKSEILDGVLAPGSRIRQEEIASRFGGSRLPVREALRALEAEGLVTLVAHTGAWVSKLDLDECLEIYRLREHVEPMLLGNSIEHSTDDDLAEIAALSARLLEATDIGDYFRYDREFHLATYRASTMPFVRTTVERLWNITQYYRSAYTRLTAEQDRRWVLDYEHQLLADAIARRDVADAQQIIETHVRRTRVSLAEHPEIFETLNR